MDIPRHWRLKPQRYNLVGSVCREKEGEVHHAFPPRKVCLDCAEDSKIENSELYTVPITQLIVSRIEEVLEAVGVEQIKEGRVVFDASE